MSKTVEELLKPRFQVKAYWPDCPFTVGDILVPDFEEPDQYVVEGRGLKSPILNDSPTRWPHLFKELKWHEHRTLEQLKSIRYMKVIEYEGYWLVGDIVPVRDIEFKNNGTLYGFRLNSHLHQVHKVVPATDAEYEAFKSKISTNEQ